MINYGGPDALLGFGSFLWAAVDLDVSYALAAAPVESGAGVDLK